MVVISAPFSLPGATKCLSPGLAWQDSEITESQIKIIIRSIKDSFTGRSMSMTRCFLVFTGSFESAQASHPECDDSQRHLWDLLDHWFINLYFKLLGHLHIWLFLLRHFRLDVHVQFCSQPFRILSAEPNVQGKDQGTVVFYQWNQSMSINRTLQHWVT